MSSLIENVISYANDYVEFCQMLKMPTHPKEMVSKICTDINYNTCFEVTPEKIEEILTEEGYI